MAFSPFARFRNFTLKNLKALLEVYPDMAGNVSGDVSWREASDDIEVELEGYKHTAYQQACQFGLEDRGTDVFRVQEYLYSFDDENLLRYIEFWLKTYYAPNPYVNSDEQSILIYCELTKAVLASDEKAIKFKQFFDERIGGGSNDILMNALREFGKPLKFEKTEEKFFVEEADLQDLQREVEFIEERFPIVDPKSKSEFFNRFTYKKFCEFYGINAVPGEWDRRETRQTRDSRSINFQTGYKSDFAHNRIVFGAPGTGKSYTLNKDKDKLLKDNTSACERVTFHPNYSYANFVGAYKPVSGKADDGNDTIKYEYVPGPFMRTYVRALENSKDKDNIRPFLLLVEEINRANAAAVFGEVFQLLDRDKDNVSEYAIQPSEDIRNYLAKKLKCSADDVTEIRIPDNMFIWATMNSADQGVFPMDTAFKRRWEFEYIGIDDGETAVEEYIIPVGNKNNRKHVSWNKLRRKINDILVSDECRVNEDKLLGPFFLSKHVLEGACADEESEERFIKAFENKVIMYLFEDVMKMRPACIFREHKGRMVFSEICRTFEEKDVGLFGINYEDIKRTE